MPTFINITVGGNSLVDKAKAQQQAARQAKLEADNRRNVEQTAIEQRTLAQAQVITSVTGNQLPIGSPLAKERRQDEPAASRQSPSVPFFVLTNINNAIDDNFTVKLIRVSTSEEYILDGIADFSLEGVTTYVWSNFATNEAQFKNSKGGKAVHDDMLINADGEIIYQEFFPLPSFSASPSELFELVLTNVQNNFNGNFGYWYAGFSGKSDVAIGGWAPGNGESENLEFYWPPVPF